MVLGDGLRTRAVGARPAGARRPSTWGGLALAALLSLAGCAPRGPWRPPPFGPLSHWKVRHLAPPESPDSRERRRNQTQLSFLALAEREARLREEREERVMDLTVAQVRHTCARELSHVERHTGSWLVVRLRVQQGQPMVLRGCEVRSDVGQEVPPLDEARFRLALLTALRRHAWGWSGDVVLFLLRHEQGWWVDDGTNAPRHSSLAAPPPPEASPPPAPMPRHAPPPAPPPARPVDQAALRRLREEEARRKAEDEARWLAVEKKLHSYEAWGRQLLTTHAPPPRLLEPGYLLTESPLREQSLHALITATLAWAYSHTDDPDFPRRHPSEVALYLLATRSSLATVVHLGVRAPPHLDYTPPYVRPYTEDELLQELLVGLVPLLGDLVDLESAVSGLSLTGHPLSGTERFLSVLGVLLPLTSGSLLKKGGGEALQQVALLSGRSLHEVHVLSRVASHLEPHQVREIERLSRAASSGHSFSPQELEFLNRVARGLEAPLREAAHALGRGQKLPLLGARTLPDGSHLVPGSPAHLAQRWVDYQFRHPGKYPRFSFSVDPHWERLYRTVLSNKPAGNAFESSLLHARGYPKNSAVMLPPPGSKSHGFVPDSVPRNPHPDELVWGRPYDFVEAKARNELALTGNLKAMIEYVKQYGGHIELWVRSPQHPSGATRLTGPLQRELAELGQLGRATLRDFP
jgi:hypothetical protein